MRLVKRTTKRKGKKNGTKNRMGGGEIGFFQNLHLFSPHSGHEIYSYL